MIEVTAFITALKHATDIFKTAVQARDEAKRGEALAELNDAFAELQLRHLEVIQKQTALLEQNEALRSQLATYDKWEHEKTRYVLRQLSSGGFIYALDPAQNTNDPPHWICANCYTEGHKSILQTADIATGERCHLWLCPRCKTKIIHHGEWPTTFKT